MASDSAGSRKKITYAHKRNRSRPQPVVSASSPIPETSDPDEYLSHAELSRRLLKRARRSSNPEVFSSKKMKSSVVTPAGSPSQFETPHPSALSEEQKFKLNSSRGPDVDPSQFSPLPVSRPRISRTASRHLKENASSRALQKGKALDSPFNSRPNSAASSPQKSLPVFSSPISPEDHTQKIFRRTLSDTHYNPNIPQSVSTTSSPTPGTHSPLRTRRPSAPSPLRWIPKEDSFEFLFASNTNDIDFNRPPSSLSFYGDSDSQFFDEVQGVSTPASQRGSYSRGSPFADDDDGMQEPDRTVTQDAMDVDGPPPTRERSAWLEDSLISPPTSKEWNRPPLDVDMHAATSSAPALLDDAHIVEEPEEAPTGGDRDLKHMFDGLALGNLLSSSPVAQPHPPSTASKNRFFNSRTRSLDSPPVATTHAAEADANEDHHPKRPVRDRRGTIRASDFKNSVAPPRRTRSGTVIGPPTTRSRSNPDPSAGIGAVNEDEEEQNENDWCADGWVVAAPPSPVVMRKLSSSFSMKGKGKLDLGLSLGAMDDELDTLSTGKGLLPSPVLHFARKRSGSRAVPAKDVVMEEDEEDDELLLKPGCNVWE
ncbi:hypothetical protein R3P38DRAFT_3341353 [Favolaschia claudopus]|uniref:Uncharacterized protein n=1 Tax=Favolaschia claudopus TaxID=2862362 RepID=A0AAW0E660_9AGAR